MDKEAFNLRAGVKELTITVTCDNNPYRQGLGAAWGFSAHIRGSEKTILFDTGGDGSLLLSNMKRLGIEPDGIDIIVLSHLHGDHSGGLGGFVEKKSGVTVYLPESFPQRFKDNVRAQGATIMQVKQPLQICEDVYSTGQVGRGIKEQALVIRTIRGLVIIIGCAHPGVLKMVEAARKVMKEGIFLVIGGFHLEWATVRKIEKIIFAFKQMGVRYVGPSHCTAEKAGTLFEKHFGSNHIKVGAGKVLTLADLK